MRVTEIAEEAWQAARALHNVDKRGHAEELRAAVQQAEVAAWKLYDAAISRCWEVGVYPAAFGGVTEDTLVSESVTMAGLHARRDLTDLWRRRSGVVMDWATGRPVGEASG